MTSRSALARKLPAETQPALEHVCPVCQARHQVSALRAEMAYGRQLCCSPDCEGERRREQRAAGRAARAERNAHAKESSGSDIARSAVAIACLLAILAAGFALRFWRFSPQLF